jgi:nucleoid-associated protein YgaU
MLAQAKAEVEQKEYKVAKESAIQTIALAEKAKEHAITGKQEAKLKAEGIVAELKSALNEAKAAEALKYYAGKYNKLSGTLSEVESDYAAEKYLDVISKGEKALAAAKDLAAASRLAAAEEARRRAEELARRKAEEEARRRAEELARLKPPSHSGGKGECLWIISEYEKIYDNPFQWPLIYKANRSQIRDPDLIFPGQDFSIPRDASADEIKQAVYTAQNRGPWSLHDGK